MTQVRIEGTGKDGMEWVGVRHASDESRWEKMDMRVYLDRQVISAHWCFTNESCDFYRTELSLEHTQTIMLTHTSTHCHVRSHTHAHVLSVMHIHIHTRTNVPQV